MSECVRFLAPPRTPAFSKRLNAGLQASPSSVGDSEDATSTRKRRRVSDPFGASEEMDEEEDVPLGEEHRKKERGRGGRERE